MPDENARSIMPFDTHRHQTTTTDGLTTGWVAPSRIEPAWPAEEITRLKLRLGEEFRRRLAAEQLVDALEDLLAQLDPLAQRRKQRKAKVAVVTARAAWESTIREPAEFGQQGESDL